MGKKRGRSGRPDGAKKRKAPTPHLLGAPRPSVRTAPAVTPPAAVAPPPKPKRIRKKKTSYDALVSTLHLEGQYKSLLAKKKQEEKGEEEEEEEEAGGEALDEQSEAGATEPAEEQDSQDARSAEAAPASASTAAAAAGGWEGGTEGEERSDFGEQPDEQIEEGQLGLEVRRSLPHPHTPPR